jgi:hypothetical protein
LDLRPDGLCALRARLLVVVLVVVGLETAGVVMLVPVLVPAP